jgi:hypothetical protein
MSKFRVFDMKRILFDDNEIYLREESDATHISISETIPDSIRVGIPNKHGVTYHYWKDIVKIMNQIDGAIER